MPGTSPTPASAKLATDATSATRVAADMNVSNLQLAWKLQRLQSPRDVAPLMARSTWQNTRALVVARPIRDALVRPRT